MKRLAFIAVFAMIGVYFMGCGIGGDSTLTLSNEDYSHLPECESSEDYIKGCLRIYNDKSGKSRSETPYKNDKINGVKRQYFADKIICEKKIVDSVIVSAELCFDKDGKPKNGVMKEYYNNGNLAFEAKFQWESKF